MTRIRPRALLAPPGWPDFMTRERFVRAGPVPLTGRAWSGRAPVTRVEVSTDGGRPGTDAPLAPADPAHPFAWRAWTYDWTATPGRVELLARATDEAGSQPVEAGVEPAGHGEQPRPAGAGQRSSADYPASGQAACAG